MKLIHKITGVLLGLTLAAGVSAGIISGSNNYIKTEAAENVATTPATTIEDGEKYVIAAGTSGTVFLSITVTNGWGIATTIDSAAEFTAEGSGTSNFALKCSAGYLAPKTGNSNNFLIYTSTTKALQLKNTNELFSNANANYNLRLNGTSGFRWYGNNNGAGTTGVAARLYKIGGEIIPAPETEHLGTESDPYSVVDARAMIDYQTDVANVYVKGVVSKIAQAYDSQYNNISFYFSDSGNKTTDIEAYRCTGTDIANVEVGDIVVVYGNLTKYNSTYELNSGCKLMSLEKELSTWCTNFLNTITCDGGVTPPSTNNWITMQNSFEALSPETQTILLSLNNDATARYDYIIGKYGTSIYSDFIGRNPTPISNSRLMNISNNMVYLPIILTVITLLSLSCGAYFLFHKRKQTN